MHIRSSLDTSKLSTQFKGQSIHFSKLCVLALSRKQKTPRPLFHSTTHYSKGFISVVSLSEGRAGEGYENSKTVKASLPPTK
jgi:hypothetical protein